MFQIVDREQLNIIDVQFVDESQNLFNLFPCCADLICFETSYAFH